MTIGNHNFVKFTVIKPNLQKQSGCVFASGKNAMYPFVSVYNIFYEFGKELVVGPPYNNVKSK